MRLSNSLVGGAREGRDVVSSFASIVDGLVVFDFGGGDTLTISNLASISGLSGDIDVF